MKLTAVLVAAVAAAVLTGCSSKSSTAASASARSTATATAQQACGRFAKLYRDISSGTVTSNADVSAGIQEVYDLAKASGNATLQKDAQSILTAIKANANKAIQEGSAQLTIDCAKVGVLISPSP